MRIAAHYSHLNGLEYLQVHKPHIWKQVKKAVSLVDADACRTKISKEKTMKGKLLYSSTCLNGRFREVLYDLGWEKPDRTKFFPTDDAELTRELLKLEPDAQKGSSPRSAG